MDLRVAFAHAGAKNPLVAAGVAVGVDADAEDVATLVGWSGLIAPPLAIGGDEMVAEGSPTTKVAGSSPRMARAAQTGTSTARY
jgi:hypothetical protein